MLLAPVVIQISEFIVKGVCLCLSHCFKMSGGKITVNSVEIISMASI